MSNKVPKKAPSMRAKAADKAEAQRAAQAAAEAKRRRAFVILGAVVGVVVLVSVITAVVLSKSSSKSEAATPGPTMRKYSCQSCHAVTADPDPGQANAPTWAGLYGSQVQLTDGTTVTADDAYLEKAINDPSAQVVAGYSPIMPERTIPPADLKKLIAEIKALQDQG